MTHDNMGRQRGDGIHSEGIGSQSSAGLATTTTKEERLRLLVIDIRNCARSAQELTEPAIALGLHAAADELERKIRQAENSRPSLPPVLASNVETRATATKHFQNTRKILQGIK